MSALGVSPDGLDNDSGLAFETYVVGRGSCDPVLRMSNFLWFPFTSFIFPRLLLPLLFPSLHV